MVEYRLYVVYVDGKNPCNACDQAKKFAKESGYANVDCINLDDFKKLHFNSRVRMMANPTLFIIRFQDGVNTIVHDCKGFQAGQYRDIFRKYGKRNSDVICVG